MEEKTKKIDGNASLIGDAGARAKGPNREIQQVETH